MNRATELAGILRHMRDHLPLDDIQKGILRESAAHLDRLAAIDSAVPGEVGEIAAAHTKHRSHFRCENMPDSITRMDTLLAIVQRQAADLTSARAEVELLKAQLAEHADHPHLYICPQVAKSAADMGKERDALKAANTALASENARLVNEHAAAMSRADVLAEGVRLLAACANIRAPEYETYQEWRSKHGHMVSK